MTGPAAPCPTIRALTLAEAARRLGKTEDETRAMLIKGQLCGCVVNGKQRVTEESVRNAGKGVKYWASRATK